MVGGRGMENGPEPPPPARSPSPQGETMHWESCSNDHMPVTWGYMRALHLLLHGPATPPPPSPQTPPNLVEMHMGVGWRRWGV